MLEDSCHVLAAQQFPLIDSHGHGSTRPQLAPSESTLPLPSLKSTGRRLPSRACWNLLGLEEGKDSCGEI